MKILQFNLTYAPAWANGGPARVLFDYAKGLVKNGHEVTVYTTDYLAPFKSSPTNRRVDNLSGVIVHYFPVIDQPRVFKLINFLPSGIGGAIRKHIRDFDVIHVANTRSYSHTVLNYYLQTFNVPYVYSPFGSLPRRGGLHKAIYDQIAVKSLVSKAKFLLAQTEHEAQEFMNYGGRQERVQILPLAVNLEEFTDLPDYTMFRKKFNIPLNAHLVLFLGRIHVTKGIDTLLDIFHLALRFDSQLHLAIVGADDGNLMNIISKVKRTGLSNKVTFTGPMYDRDRLLAYTGSDLFVITPKIWEETSLASIEALTCGTPVIVTSKADIPWLERYNAGYILDPDDIYGIANKIAHFFSQSLDQRLNMKDNARVLVKERFSTESIVSKLEALLLAACSVDQFQQLLQKS
jgi:glycosyltransferase involved in cell wall biosynthesis